MAAQPDRKRLRIEDDEEQEELVNHPSLYFDDGNVILRSGSTLFRVHRSLLSKHSPVFQELFEPKEDTKQMFLRGCLHVPMEDDREEMEALLNIIYDGLRIDFPTLTVENFPLLATLLRMTTKYQLARTRTEILARLRQEWPSTLPSHDLKTQMRTPLNRQPPFRVQDGKVDSNPQYNPTDPGQQELVHPATVIALLRRCDCNDRELLAPLFYELSRCTWTFGGPAIGHNIAGLEPVDIERLICGIERLRTLHLYHTASTQFLPLAGEELRPHVCVAKLKQCWIDMAAALGKKSGPREPLEEWKELLVLVTTPGQLAPYSLCPNCLFRLLQKIEQVRTKLWTELGAAFQLAP